MRKIVISLFLLSIFAVTFSQQANQKSNNGSTLNRPKLVIGMVVDQMRWDYLYRYYSRFRNDGGFKRLLKDGFSCDNTLIPYVPTYTACGHSCIYTGSVPAITGIISNIWWDKNLNKNINSTQDDSVKTVGSNTELGQMSPRRLQVTTICDELKLATNFHSKVFGIALKDRSSILPAGHSADAAYWYDLKTGDWITSTYYLKDLPRWVKDFNSKKLVDKYYGNDWNTLYPLNTYSESTTDEKSYESKPFGVKGFPYNLKQYAGKNYGMISSTPYGNTFTLDLARSGIEAEKLGADSITDFLAISLSTPDYIGHAFGPNSVEAEDGYLRLDRDLGDFLHFLDEKIGVGQYLFFLTADHGVSQAPGFLKEHKIPSGNISPQQMITKINKGLKTKFGVDSMVINISNYQVFINHQLMNSGKEHIDEKDVRKWIVDYLLQQPGISMAVETDHISETTLPTPIKQAITNGYNQQLSGDIQYIPNPQWVDGFEQGGTSHGSWNPYDAHIPLLWFGWNISAGKTNRGMQMTDIAPTLAALLHIQVPGGSIGHVIEEVIK